MLLIQQQRIVGTILLASAIAAVAAFLIINTKKVDVVDSHDNIQIFSGEIDDILKPELQVIDTTSKVEPSTATKVKVDEEKSTTNKFESVVEEIPDKSSTEKQVIAQQESSTENLENNASQLWFLQVASFSIKAGAKAIQKQVNALGYKAKIHKSSETSPTLYRVRIGPESNKENLDDIAVILNQKLGLKSQLIRK